MSTTPQLLPLSISIAPFPEGFSGDMDETFQQAVQLMNAFVEGNFLTGLYLPPGSTLPNTDQGPIAMGGIWYFWDPVTNQYLPQSQSVKAAVNYCKNIAYNMQQTGPAFPNLSAGITKLYDMTQARCAQANVLGVTAIVGPPGSIYNDQIQNAINYTVATPLTGALGATDLYAHEHLVEGSDLAPARGQLMTLSFWAYTANVTGTFSGYITSGGRDCSYVFKFTVTTAATWTRVVIPGIPAIPTTIGTWSFGEGTIGCYIGIGMGVGGQWNSTAPGTWQNGFFATTSGVMTNFCNVATNQLAVTGIKLEASSTATYLTVKSFEDDYHDAIRYYFTSFNYGPPPLTAGVPISLSAPNIGQYQAGQLFPRRMCQKPTITPYGYSSHTPGYITNLTMGTDIGAAINAVQKGLSDNRTVTTIATTGTTNGTTTITAIPSTTGITAGMTVTGIGIPAGTTVASVLSGTSITMSAAATSSLPGNNLTFLSQTAGITISTTCTTAGGNLITAIPSTAGLAVGMLVGPVNAGFQAGTTISQINSSTSITISLPNPTSVVGCNIIFTLINKGDVLAAYITADARLGP